MAITLDEAVEIIEGTIAKAEEFSIKVNVAVCDAGGRLIAFARMDGAIWVGIRLPRQGSCFRRLRPE